MILSTVNSFILTRAVSKWYTNNMNHFATVNKKTTVPFRDGAYHFGTNFRDFILPPPGKPEGGSSASIMRQMGFLSSSFAFHGPYLRHGTHVALQVY